MLGMLRSALSVPGHTRGCLALRLAAEFDAVTENVLGSPSGVAEGGWSSTLGFHRRVCVSQVGPTRGISVGLRAPGAAIRPRVSCFQSQLVNPTTTPRGTGD
jgi:hypothetical protein